MSATPAVSILIPTRNYARYLPAALDSVQRQDWQDYEIIISDDASTDDSAAVLQSLTSGNSRVRLHLHQTNLGMVDNWNWCLSQARGHYVKFLFGDDAFASPDALATWCTLLDRHPQAVLASSARQVINEKGRPVHVWNRLSAHHVLPGRKIIADCLYHDANLIGEPSAVIFRRDAAIRGFDPTLRQIVDLEMWFHMLDRHEMIHTDRPLCLFRRHAEQQTAKNRSTQTGPKESLIITARYLDVLSTTLTSFQRQCILHRRLHYARKRLPRSPEIIRLEQDLSRQVQSPWFQLASLRHRFMRPWQNLQRMFNFEKTEFLL